MSIDNYIIIDTPRTSASCSQAGQGSGRRSVPILMAALPFAIVTRWIIAGLLVAGI